MKKLGPFQKLALLTGIVVVVAAGLLLTLRYLINQQLATIRMHREDAAAATRVVDVATSINAVLAGRDNLVEEIEDLAPSLVEVNSVVRQIELAVASHFVERPEIRTGSVADVVGREGMQAVQFTIRGRISEQNFDLVLEELLSVPVLVEVESAAMDLKAIGVPNQGEATYVGTIYAKDE